MLVLMLVCTNARQNRGFQIRSYDPVRSPMAWQSCDDFAGLVYAIPTPWATIYINNEAPCRRGAYSFTYRVCIHHTHHYPPLPCRCQARHTHTDIHALSYITSIPSNKSLSKFHEVLGKINLILFKKSALCNATVSVTWVSHTLALCQVRATEPWLP